MGLEAGWNCHISLLNDEISLNEGPGSGPGSYIQGRRSAESASQDHLDLQGNTERKLSEEVMACRSQSAPCVIAVDEVQQVKFSVQSPEEIHNDAENAEGAEDKSQPRARRPSDKSTGSTAKSKSTSHSRSDRSEQEGEEEDGGEAGENSRLLSSSASSLSPSSSSSDGELGHQSDSRYTSSYVTEYTDDSLTGALDNRVSLQNSFPSWSVFAHCCDLLCTGVLSFLG